MHYSQDPSVDGMKDADNALKPEQRVLLERRLHKHTIVSLSGLTDIGRKSFIYYRIDIGKSGFGRQPMRGLYYKHIPVIKAEIDKLKKAGEVISSTSSFANPTIIVKRNRINAALQRLS